MAPHIQQGCPHCWLKLYRRHYPTSAIFYLRKLDNKNDLDIWAEASKKRADLIDKMADLDDTLANLIIERESMERINSDEMNGALRRITLARVSSRVLPLTARETSDSILIYFHYQTAVPVLCGSSYRNVGVQPLLDAITNYLPSPADRSYEFVQSYAANDALCSLAFKIQNDVQRGPLTFVRIYSGQIETVT